MTDVAPKLNMDNTLATLGPLPSLCYHSILPPPTTAHSHSHASNAVSAPERITTFEEKLIASPNRCYSIDSNNTQPSSLETMETDEAPTRTPSPYMNTIIPDKDLMWCNSSDSNSTTGGSIIDLLLDFPGSKPTKLVQQDSSIGNVISPKTFHQSTFHEYKSKTHKKTTPAHFNSNTQGPKNINYIHISNIISGKSSFPGLNTTNKQTLHGSKLLSMEEDIVGPTTALLKLPVPEATPTLEAPEPINKPINPEKQHDNMENNWTTVSPTKKRPKKSLDAGTKNKSDLKASHATKNKVFDHPEPVSKRISFGLPISKHVAPTHHKLLPSSPDTHTQDSGMSNNGQQSQGEHTLPSSKSYFHFTIEHDSSSGTEVPTIQTVRSIVKSILRSQEELVIIPPTFYDLAPIWNNRELPEKENT